MNGNKCESDFMSKKREKRFLVYKYPYLNKEREESPRKPTKQKRDTQIGKKERQRRVKERMMKSSFMFVCVIVILASMSVVCYGSIEDDEKECADQLTQLAACIPYVSGSAKKPTQQCCEDTKKVKENKPKCLCVLIKESADPSMGLPVNTTLALQMPSECNIDASVSNCPTLLKLPAGSPDAKLFKDANSGTSTTGTPAATTTTPSSSSSSGSSTTSDSGSSSKTTTTTTPTSNSGAAALKLVVKGSVFGLIASVAVMLLA